MDEGSDPYKEYIAEVEKIVEDYFLVSLRPPLEDDRLKQTVVSWATHLNTARVPRAKLWFLYESALKAKSSKEYFDLTSLLGVWDEMKAEMAKTRFDTNCQVCDGMSTVSVFNFKTGENENKPCVCQGA